MRSYSQSIGSLINLPNIGFGLALTVLVGIALLVLLMGVALFNDIARQLN